MRKHTLLVGVRTAVSYTDTAFPPVSASSILVGFGESNDNTIKGLTSLLSVK
jgi:hypothetical protein